MIFSENRYPLFRIMLQRMLKPRRRPGLFSADALPKKRANSPRVIC